MQWATPFDYKWTREPLCMHPRRDKHTVAFVSPVTEYWLEWKISPGKLFVTEHMFSNRMS